MTGLGGDPLRHRGTRRRVVAGVAGLVAGAAAGAVVGGVLGGSAADGAGSAGAPTVAPSATAEASVTARPVDPLQRLAADVLALLRAARPPGAQDDDVVPVAVRVADPSLVEVSGIWVDARGRGDVSVTVTREAPGTGIGVEWLCGPQPQRCSRFRVGDLATGATMSMQVPPEEFGGFRDVAVHVVRRDGYYVYVTNSTSGRGAFEQTVRGVQGGFVPERDVPFLDAAALRDLASSLARLPSLDAAGLTVRDG